MGAGAARLRERWKSWWWDLPLRSKGSLFVALPFLVLSAGVLGAVVLNSRRQSIIVLAAGFVLAIAVGWLAISLFTLGIVQRITLVSEVAGRVIDGDTNLDIEEPARDEIGMLIRQLRHAAELLILHNEELARSRDADRQRLEQQRIIRDVIRRVHDAVGQQEVLDATVHELGMPTQSDRALLLSVEDGRVGTVIAEWTVDGLQGLGVGLRLPPDPERDANFGLLMWQHHAVAIDDVTSSEMIPQTRRMLKQLDVGSLLLAPVVDEEGPLAALVVMTSGRTRPWPVGSDRWAEVVAANVATALTHARLFEREREMVERLKELDQAKSDFVASVSHELRTPLTSIRGYVEMLRDGDAGELQPEQDHMLGVVQRNADRLLSLIEDLLTLSRIESGTFRVVLLPVALDAVVRTTMEVLGPQASARGVQLEADLAPDLPGVLGDSSQLERVLFNLLPNAIKFTTEGGRVVVHLGRGDDDSVELEVEDEGIGIPTAEPDRLFTRFFRSSTSQERAIQGTGLGLVIVKSIVEHHGGEISVTSEPGVGTTFTVRLPIAVAQAANV